VSNEHTNAILLASVAVGRSAGRDTENIAIAIIVLTALSESGKKKIVNLNFLKGSCL